MIPCKAIFLVGVCMGWSINPKWASRHLKHPSGQLWKESRLTSPVGKGCCLRVCSSSVCWWPTLESNADVSLMQLNSRFGPALTTSWIVCHIQGVALSTHFGEIISKAEFRTDINKEVCIFCIVHTIHKTNILDSNNYYYKKSTIHVSSYTNPMDPMRVWCRIIVFSTKNTRINILELFFLGSFAHHLMSKFPTAAWWPEKNFGSVRKSDSLHENSQLFVGWWILNILTLPIWKKTSSN